MANLESLARSTLRRETRGGSSSTLRSVLAILGGVLLAGGCADLSDGPDDPPVDAGVTDAGSADAAIPDSGPEPATPVYFLVAELPGEEDHYDSYVLPLTRPDHIEHARALILHGHEEMGRHIVVANMSAGADGINRDLLAEGTPAWSWHVTGMIDFSDMTMEILDGWPSFVEQDVGGWIENTCFEGTEGTLGFWGYTVVDELDDYPTSLR